MLVDRLLGDSTGAIARIDTTIAISDARVRLADMFTKWRDAGETVRKGAGASPLTIDAVLAASALSRTAQMGLEALGYLAGTTRAPQGWADSLLVELKQYEQPQNMLRVMIVQPVRRLVSAAALNSH